jgi:hypothetical protein
MIQAGMPLLFHARHCTIGQSSASIHPGQLGQVLQVDVVHGVQDVAPDLAIFPIEPLEDNADLLTLARVLRGARIGRPGKTSAAVEPPDCVAVQEGEGTDHGDLTAEEWLPRQHSGDLGAIKNVHEEGFDEVIEVVAEGDLGASQPSSLGEEGGSAAASAKKTGILSILWTVGLQTEG